MAEGKTFPTITVHAQRAILRIWQVVHACTSADGTVHGHLQKQMQSYVALASFLFLTRIGP